MSGTENSRNQKLKKAILEDEGQEGDQKADTYVPELRETLHKVKNPEEVKAIERADEEQLLDERV